VSCTTNGRLDTKRENKENSFKFLFILIFIIFENYVNFYFNLKYFYYFRKWCDWNV